MISSICVFCGSAEGQSSLYREQAYDFGCLLAKENIRLVYGGGDRGLMGHVARGALEHQGHVTGIIPEFLVNKESIHAHLETLDEVIVTKDMHERKRLMFEKADAFVALPGGIGTLEELVEQLTWSQLGQHKKPIVIADFGDFWSPFFTLIAHMREQAFLGGAYDVDFKQASCAADILPALRE